MSLGCLSSQTAQGIAGEAWLRNTLVDLCAVDTTTGREERLLPCLVRLLEDLDAEVFLQQVDGARCNVLATWAPAPEARVLLSSHLDTVPPFLPPRPFPDRLLGRGSCDAKGQILAQLAAIRCLLAAGERRVAWLGVVGEETDSCGAVAAKSLLCRLPALDAVVVGEPTGNRLPWGQKGYLHLALVCHGRRGHGGDAAAADPKSGDSALWHLLRWLQALSHLEPGADRAFGREVWNLGWLRGGEAANVVAGRAVAEIVVRTVPGSTFLRDCRRLQPPRAEVLVYQEDPPMPFGQLGPWPSSVRTPAVSFGSDAPRLAQLMDHRDAAGRVFMLGPGSIEHAHTDGEHIEWQELAAGVEAIIDLCRWLLIEGPADRGGAA